MILSTTAAASRLRIRPFEAGDVERIEPRAAARRELLALGDTAARAAMCAEAGPAFTGFCGDRLVFCAGAIELWPGVAEGWALVSPLVERRRVAFHRAILGLLSRHQPAWRCHRLQATVRQGEAAAARWLSRLGFVYEGRMAGYGPDGADHLRFARILPMAPSASDAPLRAPDAGPWTYDATTRRAVEAELLAA
ncbi:MAG: hypothetical protein JNL07_11510 [Rhodospirillales bacterium]|nr:hypothetical protein [Rhodospirillales bacterium]